MAYIYAMTMASSLDEAEWLWDGMTAWMRRAGTEEVVGKLNNGFALPYPSSEEGHKAVLEHLYECLDDDEPVGTPVAEEDKESE